MLNLLSRNWWLLALRGALAVLFGVIAFIWPDITLTALVLLFGVYAAVDGLFALVAAFEDRGQYGRWWLLLLQGIVGIVAGILTVIWPGITALILLSLIAAWALFSGFVEIAVAVHLREEIKGEWLLILSGLLSVVIGFLLMFRPGTGALAVVWLIALYAVVLGTMLIVLAFRLRDWGDRVESGMAS